MSDAKVIYVIGLGSLDSDSSLSFSRIVGWFSDIKEAEKILEGKCGEILYDDSLCDYAIIETIKEGIFQPDRVPSFYRYDSKEYCYKRIPRPKEAGRYVGFTMW